MVMMKNMTAFRLYANRTVSKVFLHSSEEGSISDSFFGLFQALGALERGFPVTSMLDFINGQDETIQMKNCTLYKKLWEGDIVHSVPW